ncbi:TetR/AcrR family transcriptional regulator [Streptomyces sp. NPDC050564]|uniref:TetR/AcrR family transcriptional regulator n=1 Tax=Streptomyces sp. NPDC050564 TaxID=3365631 RepID=UPI00379300B3
MSSEDSPGFGTSVALELTPQGWATRARLVQAAAKVFAEIGFIHCRFTDITARAETAPATFFRYFDSTQAIFKAVMDEVIADFLAAPRADQPDDADPVRQIDQENRQYVGAYRKHAAIMRVFEQVAAYDDEVAEMRRALRERFAERAARSIDRWRRLGLCDRTYTPRLLADLLIAMVDNFSHTRLSLRHDYADQEIAAAMTQVWVGALGIQRAAD